MIIKEIQYVTIKCDDPNFNELVKAFKKDTRYDDGIYSADASSITFERNLEYINTY